MGSAHREARISEGKTMKPKVCINCENHKPVSGGMLCFSCAQSQASEFELVDLRHAQDAADWSNVQYGFMERSVRVRAMVTR